LPAGIDAVTETHWILAIVTLVPLIVVLHVIILKKLDMIYRLFSRWSIAMVYWAELV